MNPVETFLRSITAPGTLVMGVVNVTPDSFSDGGKYFSEANALHRISELIDEGADIIDIGGESTRPPSADYGAGSVRISADEESARVIPVIGSARKKFPNAIISIDTTKASVAREAIHSGANIINDVSGTTADSAMISVAAEFDVPVVVMHGYGPEFDKPVDEYHYEDVVIDVKHWLASRIDYLRSRGVKHIVADIGFGFAKTMNDNIRLLRRLDEFAALGVPMLVGLSRKSTIGKLLGGVPPELRANGSLAAALFAVSQGAKIVRTHDVHQTKEAFRVWDALMK